MKQEERWQSNQSNSNSCDTERRGPSSPLNSLKGNPVTAGVGHGRRIHASHSDSEI